MEKIQLSPPTVREIFTYCLMTPADSSDETQLVTCLTRSAVFCRRRVLASQDQIDQLVQELPSRFWHAEGHTLDALFFTWSGERWADHPVPVSELLLLLTASDLVRIQLPETGQRTPARLRISWINQPMPA